MQSPRFGWLALVCAGSVCAQPQGPFTDPGQHSVRMVRAMAKPVIDGKLDDAVWAGAAVVDNLHQVTPIEYAPPEERTEILLLYDDEALYIGARLYDNEPDKITANNLRQNEGVGQDDRFYVTLDPFNSRQRGYFFGINPNGVRQDGLYQNVTDFFGAWDSIFYAETSRFEGGWIAEMEIPLKSISFNPSTDTWGLNFSRGVVRKNVNSAWVSRNRAYNPAVSGTATGFEGLDPRGFDVVPSASLRQTRLAASGTTPGSSNSDFEPSLDLVYKLTPELNGSLTFNTDFSATEVDDRQVNLTRFGLFFPEKRDFFLREADIFEFGRIGAQQDNISVTQPSRENGRPFFSRRIGLSPAGEIVDLDVGAKVSGRVGNWDLGALSIQQDDLEYDLRDSVTGATRRVRLGAETLSVIRARTRVLGESTFGFVGTSGNPSADLDNTLVGADFQYRNTRLPGGRALEAEAWYQQTDTTGLAGDDAAFGAALRVPSSNRFRGGVGVKQIERNYNPALGFVDRRNVQIGSFDVGYTYRRPRGSYLQSAFFSLDGEVVEQLDGGTQTETFSLRPFMLTNRTGDTWMMVYRDQRDVLPADFRISTLIAAIPRGDYRFDDLGMRIQTGNHRKFSGTLMYVDGDFYGGTRTNINGDVTWRPSPRFRGSLGYNYNEIALPQGNFETRLVRLGFDIVFSNRISLVNLVQYDNVSETAGINVRLHWIPVPGRELYFVVNQGLQDFDRDDDFTTQRTDATVKMNYTFRF